MSCLIVGVLNVTPDSFSDGGRYTSTDDAVAAGVRMAEEGAAWIDVGGESTRPRAAAVPEDEEKARVLPVIEGLRRRLAPSIRIAIDTYKAGTARAALAAGASVVNDVSGGALDPDILGVAAAAAAAVVVGHLRGVPQTMMDAIAFTDIVAEVGAELEARVAAARAAGCREIWSDPGIGFGKTRDHNLALIKHVPALRAQLGVPLMIGVSRKAFIGQLTGRSARERLHGTAAAVAASVLGGVDAVRVHDVAAMRDVVTVAEAIAAAP